MPEGIKTTSTRLLGVDALRALALLGILSVNIWFFAHPEMLVTGMHTATVENSTDQLVRFGSALIFEGKSYVVFSFLFGLSFVLAWASAHEAGANDTTRAVRRMGALIVLGLLHGLLLFAGDILLAYGILGFILLGMRRISAKRALILAGVLYGAVALLLLLLGALTLAVEDSMPDMVAVLGDPEQALAAYTGSIGEWFAFQTSAYATVVFSILLVQGPMALAAFLVGLVVGRARILERIIAGEISTARLLAIALPALIIGLAMSTLAAVMVWGPPGSASFEDPGAGAEMLASAINLTGGPFQAAGYVILLLLLFRTGPGAVLVRGLAPAGRMSLTNYLSQSLVMVLIFSGLGLGLAGELSGATVGLVVLAIWAAQLIISHLWFTRFSRGPLEAPLRAWTYRRDQPQG